MVDEIRVIRLVGMSFFNLFNRDSVKWCNDDYFHVDIPFIYAEVTRLLKKLLDILDGDAHQIF
jgi:hypothetical protein